MKSPILLHKYFPYLVNLKNIEFAFIYLILKREGRTYPKKKRRVVPLPLSQGLQLPNEYLITTWKLIIMDPPTGIDVIL